MREKETHPPMYCAKICLSVCIKFDLDYLRTGKIVNVTKLKGSVPQVWKPVKTGFVKIISS